jgi:hypothetical protein
VDESHSWSGCPRHGRASYRAALVPALLLAILVALLLAPSAQAAPREVPEGFMGVMADGPLVDHGITDIAREGALMQQSGVEAIRVVVYWAELQPTRDGPIDWASTDRVFAMAAANHLRILPVVIRAPAWDRENPAQIASPPRGDAAYTAFLTALVARYGPQGTFWAARPDLPRNPQRQWQIWNEPNIDTYWESPRPFAKRYVTLLKASYRALKAADPGSEVVLAGFANFSWRALADAYRAGARRWFDTAAVHPFSGRLSNVLKIVRLNREAMARYGDRRKGLIISELTWPSAKGKTRNTIGFETTEAGQAARLRNAYAALLRIRQSARIRQIFWYTWLSADRDSPNSFSWSGLRKLGPPGTDAPVDKPALAEYRRVALRLEGR